MLYRVIVLLTLSNLVLGMLQLVEYPQNTIYVGDSINIKLTSTETEELTLKPSQQGVLEGNLKIECNSGITVEFNDLKFNETGSYAIFIQGTISSQISFFVTVEDSIQQIYVVAPTGFASLISDFITIYAKDTKGNPWPNNDNIKLTTDDKSFEELNQKLDNGQTTFSVSFITDGTKTLNVITPETTKTFYVAVGPRILKYIAPIQPSYSSDSVISVLLQVYDTKGAIPLTDQDYSINLELVCTSSCSSNVIAELYSDEPIPQPIIQKSAGGQTYFGPFRIISSGKFYLKASCNELPSAFSTEFFVVNKYKDMTFSLSTDKITANFNFDLTIKLIGQDGFPSTTSSTIFIKDSSGSLEGEVELIAKQGFCITTLWFNAYGDKVLAMSSLLSDDIFEEPISVASNTIVIEDIPEIDIPTTTRESFILNITIMDSEKKFIENAHGPHKIEFSLDPDGELDGTQRSAITNNGSFLISDLIPKDSGDFYLVITLDGNYKYTYSDVEFSIESASCFPGSGPISCMSVLIFLSIILSVVFAFVDKNVKKFPSTKFVPFLIHTLTSLFYKQPKKRRLLLCLTIFTSELIMLTIIGGIYAYYDSPTERYNKVFEDYYGRLLYKGATGWALAQAGIIPIFFLTFYSIGNKNIVKANIAVCVIMIFLCFGAIVGMTVKYCIGYSIYWTANFLIFILFDVLVMQPIYTIICYYLMTKDIRDKLYGLEKDSGDESAAPNDAAPKDEKGLTNGNPDRDE
ncbi:hypothetical protein SteCoe_28099 [Stentor coeruleus]|uniref:Uncharacterized protein n=1 Tax=Stentor coeruleus TaxID=5963 RepID=A0A1R2B928_9CILI|nr:hypothetical protein SteCoe_28099 [Stentor coeruleus]